MRTIHILVTLIALHLSIFAVSAQSTPQLTVVVVVDGMTQENLTMLRPYWAAGGLRTLSEEAYQTSIQYPHLINGGQETTATLMTGTTPSRHSIMGDYYFSRMYRQTEHTLQDDLVGGIGTKNRMSPRNLLATTISDEWRIRYGSAAKIYAIGLQPDATIIMAGHAANACCWLDDKTQKWVTTSFYSEGLPSAADAMNVNGRISDLASKPWGPRMDIAMYTKPTKEERKKGFQYTPSSLLHQTPAANTLVIELALSMQKSAKLGDDLTPDILFLQLTTTSPKAHTDAIQSAEQEDMYLGINQDLGYLMDQLNRRIGKNNYQIMVVGRPVKGSSLQTFESAGIPIQRFNVDRAAALTSTYLMAIYGHERWVDGGYGPFIFLNRTLIEQKRLSLETIQRQVANFLMDFEGVQVAYPIHEAIITESHTSIYRKHAGDVYFELQSHWLLDNNENEPYDHIIDANPSSPLLFWTGTLRTYPDKTLSATDIKSLIIK